ncbi:MAG: hypothetical protein PHT62_10485 [Desulfotomaculaceae bacterium]|nr:hypothetical protein [Desulfotomaculaceae bacterium]
MTARRRSAHRKPMEDSSMPGRNQERKDLPVRDCGLEVKTRPSPTEGQTKSQGSLPVTVVLEIIGQEYREGAQEEALCRVALRLAEESGQIESYRARWDEADSAPAGLKSALLFDRNQCLELINFFKSSGRTEKLQQEKVKLAQLEGRLLLGGEAQTRITDEDLDKLENFIKESGF